ncbi:LysR family transcriptional regulator [Novacetimonas hansenii]
MNVFVNAADLGSFAATAEALGMSAQMVAKHVAFLEARLGTTLLSRTTRRQSLTDIGRAYYDRCKQVLMEVDAADALAADMRARPTGTLRVTHTPERLIQPAGDIRSETQRQRRTGHGGQWPDAGDSQRGQTLNDRGGQAECFNGQICQSRGRFI